MRRYFYGASALMLLLAAPSVGRAQQIREITGRVTQAATGAPLPDISVGVVGQLVGARTNEKGEFRIRVQSAGDVTLQTRALGYKRQTQRLAVGQTTANFSLEKDVLELEGVTVTGAATSVDRRNATSAVASVNSEELNRVPAVSVESALQGKVLGATISMNNGAPGGGGQIQIRGASSLIGRIDPLYVVDGVIISNGVRSNGQHVITGSLNAGEENGTNRLADINPNDIENIEILKGSVASAIYGSQATNGVVVITTKRGTSGAPRFNFTQRVGTYQLIRDHGLRHFKDLATLLASSQVAGNDAGIAAANSVCTASGCPYHDYIKELYGRTDPSLETSANLSGGIETTKYYVSVTDKQDAGIAMNTGARHQSLRASLDQTIGSRITASIGSTMLRSFSQRGISNNDNTNSSPIYGFAYTPNVLDLRHKDAAGNYPINPFGGGPSNISNPFQTFDLMRNNEDVYRILGSANIAFAAYSNATNDVRFNVLAGVDRSSTEAYLFAPASLQFEQPGTNNGTYPGAAVRGNGDNLLGNTQVGGVWVLDPTTKWFRATTSAGIQREARQNRDYTIVAQGLTPGVLVASGAVHTTTGDGQSEVRNQAYYASEEFLTAGERLLLSAGLRGEKSTVNGDPKKLYTFPRFGASLHFANPVRFISDFKIRGTRGEAGNQPSYGDSFLTLTNAGLIDGQTALIQSAVSGNAGIKPERLTETEYGFDGALFNDRVHMEATWFNRDIHDLLVRPLLAPSTGVNQEIVNGGKMRTRGTELGLTVVPIESRGNGVTWTSRVTYQTNGSRILSFNQGVLPFTIGAAGGFGTAFGRLKFSPGQSTSAIYGNYVRKDGSVARDTILGDANPTFQMGFSNDVTWGNWTFAGVADYRKGGTVSNLTLQIQDEGNTTWDYDKKSPNPAVGTTLGSWRYNSWSGGNNTLNYLSDGSFFKIRELTAAYTVPSNLVSRFANVGVRSARFSVSGRNMFIISAYNGYDPEVNNGGNQVARFVDLAPFPPSRSYFLSVDLGF